MCKLIVRLIQYRNIIRKNICFYINGFNNFMLAIHYNNIWEIEMIIREMSFKGINLFQEKEGEGFVFVFLSWMSCFNSCVTSHFLSCL